MKIETITSAILANCQTASTKECAFLIDIVEHITPIAKNVVISNAGAILYTDIKTVLQVAKESMSFMFSGISGTFHVEIRRVYGAMTVDLYHIDLNTENYYNLTIREWEE